jgi:hypothetical protein
LCAHVNASVLNLACWAHGCGGAAAGKGRIWTRSCSARTGERSEVAGCCACRSACSRACAKRGCGALAAARRSCLCAARVRTLRREPCAALCACDVESHE